LLLCSVVRLNMQKWSEGDVFFTFCCCWTDP
jgi:hypothetical protein